jgi:hypothetical protein
MMFYETGIYQRVLLLSITLFVFLGILFCGHGMATCSRRSHPPLWSQDISTQETLFNAENDIRYMQA